MKSRILLDVSFVLETAIQLDPDRPEAIEEDLRRLLDMLSDLKNVLSRYT